MTIEWLPAIPEIFMACAAMALLMVGVFTGRNGYGLVSSLAVVTLVVAAALVVYSEPAGRDDTVFGGLFVTDTFAMFFKLFVLAGSALTVIMSVGYNTREGIDRFEYPVLVVLATLGMMMMVSANDLIALYLGLELQSLALYVVAAIKRDSVQSTEAGLKYFVLGALSSGMLLYGASMIYGFAGTTSFNHLAAMYADGGASAGAVVGVVFVVAGLAFKLGAVPFHMWTPDVYEGAPTPVTAFFAAAPKLAAMGLFLRVLLGPFGELGGQWQQVVILMSLGSMILGAFAAINQRNIKRMLAYSGIGHIGYALIGLATLDPEGYEAVLVYMGIYYVTVVGTFACVLAMVRQGRSVEGIDDLAGLSRTHPGMAALMTVFMFSMAGVPPFAGFFGKLYVFLAAIEAELYTLAILGVLSSVVAAFYYLRIVKIIYFDEAPTETLDRPTDRPIALIQGAAGIAVLLFFLLPGPLVDSAKAAIGSLVGG